VSGVAPVLVTGAAGGTQGSTGRMVTGLLRERGQEVRAFVHSDDDRAAGLRALGADVVAGDLREIASVLPAVHGADRVFFTYPVTEGLLDATAALAAAARPEGMARVVNVSQLAAAPDAPTPHMRQHWLSEQVLDRAEVGAVHLRAAVFFENLAVLADASDGRELAMPLGPPDTVVPLVAAEDVARVGAGLLTAPMPDTAPVCLLTGQAATIGEIADAFGLRYTEMAAEEWERRAMGLYGDAHTVAHLTKLWEIFRLIGSGHDLYEVTATIERYGGRPPRTLGEFTRARARA
jgi:uncharacterized protein YbjT (DUF2867 family)